MNMNRFKQSVKIHIQAVKAYTIKYKFEKAFKLP